MRVLYLFVLLVSIGASRVKTDEDCPTLNDADNLSQTQLLKRLTHGCRYDYLERPILELHGTRLPVDVYVRAYIYFVQNLEAHDLQFKIHALLQLRFLDSRLTFRKIAPKRKQPILGEKQLRDTLWMPHIFLANERDSSILGTTEQDILTSISPDGTVIVASRIKATLYCWMNLQKFPFDEQHCSTIFESWMYNTSELILHWEQKHPITFDPALHLTEYVLQDAWSNETVINADFNNLRHGAFAGNYSSLSFTIRLTRELGFYLMDYFLPSMLIVGISWVSFWLQADQAPPRIMLGTTTMLTFITLSSAQGKTLPKVSYIKVSEVWFFGCTLFIFGSLVEFAFVNTIWRRKCNIDVKKNNYKHLSKSTISPRSSRRRTRRSHSFTADATTRINSKKSGLINEECELSDVSRYDQYFTVHNIPVHNKLDGQNVNNKSDITSLFKTNLNSNIEAFCVNKEENVINIENDNRDQNSSWATLTPQEISMAIDRKARCIFPVTFLIFNILFWSFVYVL